MKKILISICLLIAFSACFGPKIKLSLDSAEEGIPFPRFRAEDPTNESALPVYSDIRVYDVTDGCRVPACQLVWHLTVSDAASPTKFTYGAFPSFGSTTVVSPKRLKPSRKYRLVVGQAQNTNPSDSGYFDFVVGEDGRVKEAED